MRNSKILVAIFTLAFFLRLVSLYKVPPSLHGDEIGVGYNAWTLLSNGADEYGVRYPITLRADVSPLIFYITVPSIALFGMNEFAVRLPSAIIGTLTVLVTYSLAKKMFLLYSISNSSIVSLLFAFFLAISPWHVQVSRIAHDAGLALLLQMMALTLFIFFLHKEKSSLLYFSASFFGLSIYAYHSPSFTTPLLMLLLFITFKNKLSRFRNTVTMASIIFVIVVIPLAVHRISKPLADTRFGGINIFIREQPEENLILAVPRRFVVSFINQINPVTWFLDTSSTRYFNVKNNGFFYILDLGLILLGVYRLKSKLRLFLLVWIFIGLSAGALTSGPLNGGRILLILPPLLLFGSIGFHSVLQTTFKVNRYLPVFVISIYVVSVTHFLIQYFTVGPNLFYREWQYGAREVAQFALMRESQMQKIVITDQIKQGYIYVLFYGRKSPSWIQSIYYKRHPYIGYSAFGNFEFRPIDWEHDRHLQNSLLIGTPEEIPTAQMETSISAPDGTVLFGTVQTK